jgi:hypothetical protein
MFARFGVDIGGRPDDSPKTVFAPAWRDMSYPSRRLVADSDDGGHSFRIIDAHAFRSIDVHP